ncbi:MAG: peptidoglycan-binding protein, partial [Patescibacteria group bacterium]
MFKKYLVFGFLSASNFIIPFTSKAQPSSNTREIAQLIIDLQRQIVTLRQQLAELQGSRPIPPAGRRCYVFQNNLKLGDSGEAVTSLNTALTEAGFPVTNEQFTEATAAAVRRFQEKYAGEILTANGLARGTGYVGPATRRVLNRLFGCGVTPSPDRYLRLLSPNGGEAWERGSQQKIAWDWAMTSADAAVTAREVSIYLSPFVPTCPLGANCISPVLWTIASGVKAANTYDWTVGQITDRFTPPAGNYYLEICSPTRLGSNVCDKSDYYFKIYDSGQTSNRPPSVNGVDGPITLVAGATGSGKSVSASVFVEEALDK